MSLSLNRLYNSTLYTSLSLPPPLFIFTSFSSLLTEQTYFPVTRTLKLAFPTRFLLPPLASPCLQISSHLNLAFELPLLPGYISISRVSSLSSLLSFYFLPHHFTRHELRLLSPTHLFPSPSPSSPLTFFFPHFLLSSHFHFNFHFQFSPVWDTPQ